MSATLTPEQAAELRRLLEKATPGPLFGQWVGYQHDARCVAWPVSVDAACCLPPVFEDDGCTAIFRSAADAVAYAALHNAAPALLAAVDERDALRARIAELEAALKPFAERGGATFTVGDYHNPDNAPDTQIFGTELFLTVGDLRRARAALQEDEGKGNG